MYYFLLHSFSLLDSMLLTITFSAAFWQRKEGTIIIIITIEQWKSHGLRWFSFILSPVCSWRQSWLLSVHGSNFTIRSWLLSCKVKSLGAKSYSCNLWDNSGWRRSATGDERPFFPSVWPDITKYLWFTFSISTYQYSDCWYKPGNWNLG